MAKAKKKTAPVAAPQEEATPVQAPVVVEAFKGFDSNWKCRGMQYAVGQTVTHDGKVVRCGAGGFHSCEMPLDIWNYYRPNTSRFAVVEASGTIDRATDGDTKIASASLTVKAELKLPDLISRAVRWILERAKGNTATTKAGHAAATGNYGHAAATGYSGHAAATGYSGHAAATGNYGHAAATGNYGHAAATGYYGHAAATGESGHAAATGYSGHAAATGKLGCAFAGFGGKAKAGEKGSFAIAWFDEAADRARLIVGTPGVDGIKADTLYRVDGGKLVEVTP